MHTNKLKKLLPYVMLAVLFTISGLTWQYYDKTIMEREERRFDESVNQVVSRITERLEKHKMILRGGAGVFHASQEVTREEWTAYYQYQRVRFLYPGIQGVAFSRVVQSSELTQHIDEIRAEGFLNYMVWPEGERDLYAPIVFIEPFDEENRHYLGFDLFSEVILRTVMEQAQNNGEVSMTDMVNLMDESGEGTQPGFLMFAPVYTQGLPPTSLEERKNTLEGYVFGTYYIDELMLGIFSDSMHNIDFHLYDGSKMSPEALMYYSHVTLDTPSNEVMPLFTSQKTLNMFGHQWTLVFESTPFFEADVDLYTPSVIFITGLLGSLLLFVYLKTLGATNDQAKVLAQKMTASFKESEEKYRLLTENITDVIWTIDLEGHLTYISPAIEKMLGFTSQEIMTMPIHQYIVKKDYDEMMMRLFKELAKPQAERTDAIILSTRYKTKDNRIVYGELNVLWIKDEQGDVIGVQGSTRDITERKKMEEKIIDSQIMYQSVIDTQQEMICRYLPDTTITFVNDAYCRAFNKPAHEIVGHQYLRFLPPELHKEELKSLKRLHPKHPSDTREFEVILPDGSIVWQQWTDVGIFDDLGKIVEIQGVGRDITERVIAEKNMIQAYDATIEGWAYALDLKDGETVNHSQRVTELTLDIARKMGINEEELVHIRRGALLHDIGKMGIPDSILLKPSKLSDKEWEIMRKHPIYAFEMLSAIDYLHPALDIPYCHHEKWDGSGYPRGLKENKIPLAARIFAVIDVYDALTSDRPYRKAWTKEKTLKHIKKQSGKHFDPQIVDVFIKEVNG